MLVSLLPSFLLAQQATHEETVIRNADGKVSFLCRLEPIAKAAIGQIQNNLINSAALQASVLNATPTFDLSDIKTGNVSHLAEMTWRDVVTVPSEDSEVIFIDQTNYQFTDVSKHVSSWLEFSAKWVAAPSAKPASVDTVVLNMPVLKMLALGGPMWSTPATYTRYALVHGKCPSLE